jgi:hypothetical protein
MLFWLINCANMLLNSFKKVENWFSIFADVSVWLILLLVRMFVEEWWLVVRMFVDNTDR